MSGGIKSMEQKKERDSSDMRKEQPEQKEYRFQNEAACSAEFSEGCIFSVIPDEMLDGKRQGER